MSKTYTRGTTPRDVARLPEFLDAELAKLERSFGDAQPSNTLQWLTASPTKLYSGMVVLANGADWNPLGGEGLHIRNKANDAWRYIVTLDAALASGVATWLKTPSSANLRGAVTDETGTGSLVFATSPTLVTPNIGAATGTSLAVTGAITTSGASKIGYVTGAGGTVTQATSKTTAVTLDKPCGSITLNNAALAANTTATFRFDNSLITGPENIVLQVAGGGTSGAYQVWVASIGSGFCTVAVRNITAGSLSESPVIRFSVLSGSIT